jgi:hypothetical protein
MIGPFTRATHDMRGIFLQGLLNELISIKILSFEGKVNLSTVDFTRINRYDWVLQVYFV